MSKGNIFLPFLVCLTIITIAVGGLFVWQNNKSPAPSIPTITPTKAPEPDWQTISNDSGDYILKIPNIWKEEGASINFPDTANFLAPDGSVLRIQTEVSNSLSLTDYLVEADNIAKTGWEGEASKKVLASKHIIVAGKPAVERQEDWLAAGFTTTVVYVASGDKIYTLSIIPSGTNSVEVSEAQKYFSQVLATFNFL